MDKCNQFVVGLTMMWLMVFSLSNQIARSDQDINCDSTFITCPCGRQSSNWNFTVRVELATCYADEDGHCVLCNGQTVEDVCSRYERCATCGQGLDRCLACPTTRYGEWCDKDCHCKHGGHCDPTDGTCHCPRGFFGKRCELVIKDMVQHSHVHRRQIGAKDVTCPILPAPSNGEVHIEAAVPTLNDAVKYTCKENYTMIGSSARHCLRTGQWAGEAPTCEKLCPFPIVDPHVKVAINPDRAGAPHLTTLGNEVLSELVFSCDPRFVLSGTPRVRCASGLWDQDVPKCVHAPECADPGDPESGERFVIRGPIREQYQMGTQLFFNCSADSTLVGPTNITCMPFSQWSAPIPLCVPNVISDCVYECKSASATVLDVSQKPLICSPEFQRDVHVVLRPRQKSDGNF